MNWEATKHSIQDFTAAVGGHGAWAELISAKRDTKWQQLAYGSLHFLMKM